MDSERCGGGNSSVGEGLERMAESSGSWREGEYLGVAGVCPECLGGASGKEGGLKEHLCAPTLG